MLLLNDNTIADSSLFTVSKGIVLHNIFITQKGHIH